MKDYRFSPQAWADIQGIWAFVAKDDGVAASALIKRFLDAFELLVTMPKMGRLRPDLEPGIRSHVCNSYVVLYRERGDYVYVQRVIHGARDMRKVLRDEGYGE